MATPMPPACAALTPATGDERHRVSAAVLSGRENDGSGLDYYRARYYQPTWGRFVSEDPIGLAGGDANLYAYVRDNPLNLVDPLGLQSFTPGGVINIPPGMGTSGPPFGGGSSSGGVGACPNPCEEAAKFQLARCQIITGGAVGLASGAAALCGEAGPEMPLCVRATQAALAGPAAAAAIGCRLEYRQNLRACGK